MTYAIRISAWPCVAKYSLNSTRFPICLDLPVLRRGGATKCCVGGQIIFGGGNKKAAPKGGLPCFQHSGAELDLDDVAGDRFEHLRADLGHAVVLHGVHGHEL